MPFVPELRVGVLVSHNGSNLHEVHMAALEPGARFEVVAVISNNSGSRGLAYAKENRIPTRHLSGRTHPDPDELDEAIRATLEQESVDLVGTAGHMRKRGAAHAWAVCVSDHQCPPGPIAAPRR
ncbi:formyltransferase family protein [Nocardia sp. CA-129566]|uniref:formyltransferase family protein n=1 Tax=Nocardia sp. CA-129566 TaxID=3239976 RepID=UPI003D96C538